jgi:hypothetical protein
MGFDDDDRGKKKEIQNILSLCSNLGKKNAYHTRSERVLPGSFLSFILSTAVVGI